jgi:uracil phosphoribosyltransferase
MNIQYISEENSVLNQFLNQIRTVSVQKDSMRFRRNMERIGEILAYEIKYNPNKKVNFTKSFTEKYHPKETLVVNKDNFWEYLQ